MKEKVVILGAGAWGTAFSTLLSNNKIPVILWCFEPEVACEIEELHENKKYLPGIQLDPLISATSDLEQALADATLIFEATPVRNLRSVFDEAKSILLQDRYIENFIKSRWVFLSKGIEQHTLLLPSQIFDDVFQEKVTQAVIAGPNFAKELAQKSFTATSIASQDRSFAQELSKMLSDGYFVPFISEDPIGLQVGGAIKNVLALAVGLARGAGYKENAIAYLLTQGLAEMGVLTEHFGGKKETVYGLSGLGDMILTCMGSLSKNLRVGKLLGGGKTFEQLKTDFPVLPEGINTIQSIHEVGQKANLQLPLCLGIYSCIFEGKSFKNIFETMHVTWK